MATTISDLRKQLPSPPVTARPLAIIHGLDGMLRRRSNLPPDLNWMPPPDTTELHDNLLAALEHIRQWGFGGVVANVGWQSYLEDEGQWAVFLEAVRACREMGLRVWIYDELGYPSGSAGGLVLRGHPEFEAEVLVLGKHEVTAGQVEIRPPSRWRYRVRATARIGDRELDLTPYMGGEGWLRWEAPDPCTIERYDVRAGFEGTHATGNVHAVRRYVNVLDPDAVKRFHDVTYRQYIDRMGADLEAVEAFFTDEPSFMTEYFPDPPEDIKARRRIDDVPLDEFDRLPQLPWRADLPKRFAERWDYDILPGLRSLFEGDSLEDMRTRHDFHQLVSELYAEAFFKGLQDPLREHGIAFSGHVLVEESIIQHCASEGSVMADLKEMEKPGIDMLTSVPERILETPFLLTCKYGSSAAHVCGRNDIMSEVSDWIERMSGASTTIEQRRGALAVQAALGITTFTSYFNWKGFDPEDIRRLMAFCGRVTPAVRDGIHVAPVAILYPIRTAWAHYLPAPVPLADSRQPEPLALLDAALYKIARALLGKQIDFDFVDSRSLIESHIESGRIGIADEEYRMLVIPPGTVVCPKDIETVRRFAESGGRVLAFKPLSEVSLRGTKDESLQDVLRDLASAFPDRIHIANVDDAWVGFAEENVTRDLVLVGDTESVLVRQSKLEDGSAFVVVNASKRPVELEARLAFGEAELLDPWDGGGVPFSSPLPIDGYGAKIILARQGST